MGTSSKTLILIDNSLSVSQGNRDIIKATTKYLLENSGDDHMISFALFGEDIEYVCDYEDDIADKLSKLEKIEFRNRDTYITDAVMNTVSDWKKADVALRNIILISDGMEEESELYTNEELYLTLKEAEYPVYSIACVQKNNAKALKGMAAISRMSGGEIFYTEFDGSDAGVEKQLSEKIFTAMDEYERTHAELMSKKGENDENDEEAETEEGTVSGNDAPYDAYDVSRSDVFMDEYGTINPVSASNVVYEMSGDGGFIHDNFYSLLAISVMLSIVIVFIVIFIRRQKRYDREDKAFFETLKTMKEKEASEEIYGKTGRLNMEWKKDEEDTGTRLLFESSDSVQISLEDRMDPTKYYRADIIDTLVIGRSAKLCDIVIDYDDSISAKHCEISLRNDSLYIRDLNSSNGTAVNNQKVYQELKIMSGDVIRIGRLSFFLQVKDR